MPWLLITGNPAWNIYNPHSMPLTTDFHCDETTNDSHFTVRACKGNTRSQASKTARGHSVTDSHLHCCSATANRIEFSSNKKELFDRWCILSLLELAQASSFRCEALNGFQSQRVKSLFSISGSSVETDARVGLRVPIVSKHVCAHCLISFSPSTCSH